MEFIENESERKNNSTINEFKDGEIQVLRGRYGPYIKSGKINARIPKNKDPEKLTLEECEELIKISAERKGRKK